MVNSYNKKLQHTLEPLACKQDHSPSHAPAAHEEHRERFPLTLIKQIK